MVNKNLNAVSVALHEEFGDSFQYYLETVNQELEPPCFTFDMLNPMERSTNQTSYYRTMPVVVHYFNGDSEDLKKDCYAIGERALTALEYITIEGQLIRGEGMEMRMNDDVLQMSITYRFWTEKDITPEETMLTVDSEVEVQ